MKFLNFEQVKILVVGDIMLDRYWYGEVSRISPEAPVPIVNIQRIEERIGGGGNVALNIKSIGGTVNFLGLVGDDADADFIERSLKNEQIRYYLLRLADFPTITKLRVISHNQQLIRLDREQQFKQWPEEQFFSEYLIQLAKSDLVILSDYGKGTLKHSARLIKLAREMHKPVLVDPKSCNFDIYRGATLIKPNIIEFEAIVGHCRDNAEIESKARNLLHQYEIQAILVTRGAYGMSLIRKDIPLVIHLPAKSHEIYDVTGAGDTVIAVFGTAIASGMEFNDAMMLANFAASVVVKKLGASTVSLIEIFDAFRNQQDYLKVLDEDNLLQQVNDARLRGEKIVMTNGCFDILHYGHIRYLKQAKALGHRLIVAVNDDNSVSRFKGHGRPINKVDDRMMVLSALDSVDWVIRFAEDTPKRLISLINPDILVKGDDYKINEIAGSEYILANGGIVTTIPLVKGFSTSNVIEKIKKLSAI
jgi:D-beta-D-heptose 7-phosphate kinase/D-beta-D-heptose 1-phosphate adenosyltransferase